MTERPSIPKNVGLGLDPTDIQQDPDNIITTLSSGLLGVYQPGLEKVRNQLDELTKKQTAMIIQLEGEYKKLSYPEQMRVLEEMHTKIETYTTKLTTVKRDMHQTAEKITQLKKRALWLQAAKQKEALQLECQKESQLQREQELIAKPIAAASSSSSPS